MVAEQQSCQLCGLTTSHPIPNKEGKIFCCLACKEVSGLLENDPLPEQTLNKTTDECEDIVMGIGGLWCASCAWLVEERLKRVKGVQVAQVSYVQRKAQISYDPRKTAPRKLQRKLKLLGYHATLGTEPEDEEDSFFTRMLVGGMIAMHIMIISLIIYVRGWMGLSTVENEWLENFFYLMQFALSIPLIPIFGLPILRAGIASLVRGLPNIQTLVSLGAISAFIISSRNLFLESGHVYFDTAAMLLFLVTIGRWLEMKAHKASSIAVEEILHNLPTFANCLNDKGEVRVAVENLQPGNRILIRPGEHFPVDGVVAKGQGLVDESLLTGETKSVLRTGNESVFAGTINLDGVFEVIVSHIGADTRAGQIGKLLHQALWQRAPVEQLADKLAARMVWIAIAIALGAYFYWNTQSGYEVALLNALSVLLIACPCALGVATPLTLWQALEHAARNGAVLRSTAVIEKLGRVKTIYFDKTGTLTQLPLKLQKVATIEKNEDNFLSQVVSLEDVSEHPFAQTIVQEGERRGLKNSQVSDFRVISGWGVTGKVKNTETWIGNRNLMEKAKLNLPAELNKKLKKWQAENLSIIYAGWEGKVRGIFGIGESIHPDSLAVIDTLKKSGIKMAILTGDTARLGKYWQSIYGIQTFAGLQPEEKLSLIRNTETPVMMVGDGINDGPSLAAATVGLTFNKGADIAQTASEVVLLNDDLYTIPWLLSLANEASKRVKQNLIWALAYNLVGIGLAVSGFLQPVLAAIAMLLSSLLVTQNALRLRNFPPPTRKSNTPTQPANQVSLPNSIKETLPT